MPTHARHFDFLVIRNHPSQGTTVVALQTLCFRYGSSQSSSDVARDVVATGRYHGHVRNAAVHVQDDVSCATANVDDRDANLLFVIAHHGVGAGQGLEHDVGHA